MYDALAHRVRDAGGTVRLSDAVVAVHHAGGRVCGVTTASGQRFASDAVLSSIPLTVLVEQLDPPAPPAVREAARRLRFRHLVAVNLIVEGEDLFPDTWVYVHSPELRVGRIQNYGNWSPHMVPEPGRSALGIEYFTEDGDDLWARSDDALVQLATDELARTGLCRPRVLRGMVVRAPRAYPVYARGYEAALATLTGWLRRLRGLQPIGRYGMFKYNNSDHSILTAMLAVENLVGEAEHDVWAVNSDEQYVEERPAAG